MDLPIEIEQVAKAFSIPATNIRQTIKTKEVAAKYGEAIHAASLFEFESEPTVTMQAIVTKGRFLLTDVLRSKLESEPVLIKKVDLGNAGAAFIGLEGAGPGAESYVAIAHLPSQNLDFRLRVMISNDGITASDVSSASTLRSGSVLRKALQTLALSSGAKLSQTVSPVLDPTIKSISPVEPSERRQRDAQVAQTESAEHGTQPALSEQKTIEWKPFAFAIAGIVWLWVVATYWRWRKIKMNQENGCSKWTNTVKLFAVSIMILSTGMAVVIACRFSPPNRIELKPIKGSHRLFAVAINSADGTVLVNACDWPYTFFSPFVLGDAVSPEKHVSTSCRWSNDGTLVVWEVQDMSNNTIRYDTAYDFREHQSIDIQRHSWNAQVCHEAIAALVAERGGLQSLVIDIPSLNSGLYEK